MSTATLAHTGDLPGTAARGRHGSNPILRVVRLHFVDRMQMIWVPIIMLASVAALCVVIMVVLQAFTPGTAEELSEGFRYNQAALWSWPGFIVTIGVYAYARTMPFAIGMMGSTRRHYWAGTALWILVESVYLSALVGVFLLLEQATGHWFTGARMFDVYALGNGHLGLTLLLSFAMAAACLSVGAGLAAVYLRWGQYGVMAGIAAILVIVLGTLALVLASDLDVATFFTTNLIEKASALLLVIAALATAVSWVVMRRVPVGR
ncbi:hypothetical protein [Citricoccus sp. I39-566]|uniref:hypothetical protein n=1 Tax=Citricoccus sp. I39-566 TaxID=3073268 RepID=UPI00286C9FB7|nr:hypothetical protein [Citricoccus sp. I39-566]WMY78971.1 hypothetical protein RE421_03650 [Citricoccus sp. I39-566]